MGDDLLGDPQRSRGENIGAGLREYFNPMINAWHQLRAPVVVAVNGVAAGAGVSLALIGDIVLAARSATFLQLFAPKLGLMPDLGSTFHLPRLVGTARAKGLALLGDALSAADAASWGLIWACVDDEALAAQAQTVARRFATGPTQAKRSSTWNCRARWPNNWRSRQWPRQSSATLGISPKVCRRFATSARRISPASKHGSKDQRGPGVPLTASSTL